MSSSRPPELRDPGSWRPYAYLFGQYLGDGCISAGRRDVYRLRVTCADSWPLVMELVGEAMLRILSNNKVGRLQREGCTEIGMSSKRWPDLFPQHGSGPKHKRILVLAEWQKAIVYGTQADAFVCGLLHSDGCRAMNKINIRGRRYEYPRYFLSNRSEDIHAMFAEAAAALAITTTRSGWQQSVARNQHVALLDRLGAAKDAPLQL